MSRPAAEWPPSRDRVLWAWIAAAHALPGLAWALDASFWLRGLDGGPYRPTSPLTWAALEPVLALALVAGRSLPFGLAVWIQLAIGFALMGTLLQAPDAVLHAGSPAWGLGDSDLLGVVVGYALAVATGAAFVGQGAYTLRLRLAWRPAS